ncbi:MAG: insulinase family protein [Tannerella sp.]|jgi:predicted Zn-dependent peptidase|nr:insulinase family protein [Tannerella sp.]
MKKYYFLILAVLFTALSCQRAEYKYDSVDGDPLNVRIYTLENGLKVYLSVNKDKPRVQTYIGVRVGGKNDPAETTGLAHYFEHLMFKGTPKFGTSNYEAEKPLLDMIESLFETYRNTTDDAERKAIYARIDSASQEASKIAIPNEYDKLMTSIGAQGTNAFTSYDVTAYTEDVPANEIESWAIIQSERFTNPIIRGFHTELETVYEEYNMSLTRDGRKVSEAVLNALFPHHPYGTQTILGTSEHLKNPSITNIKKYFDTYYAPNNMAIVMSGDINPEEVIAVIDKYFKHLKPREIPALKTASEQPITEPVVKEVTGVEAENVAIAYRLPGANTKDADIAEFIDYLITNGRAGLIDVNLTQKQKVLSAGSSFNDMADYGIFTLSGSPKQGQTLEEVRDLLLAQLELLKKGEFDDWLMEAVINNFRLNQYYQRQEYQYAASLLLNSFINKVEWKDFVGKIDFQSKLTKTDVIDFCNKYFNDNYVIVYKRKGAPTDNKIEKPKITPIQTNRDVESEFLAKIKSRKITPVEPVFVDYSKDLTISKAKSEIPLLYKQNTADPLFQLTYVYEMGTNNDKSLDIALRYLRYLGTSAKTAEQINSEFYKIACSFSVSVGEDRSYVYISGLNDKFDAATALFEECLNDAKADKPVYDNMANDIIKQRSNSKLNQQVNFSRLSEYAVWGPKSSTTNILSEKELLSMNPENLVNTTKNLKNFEHTILYYGPLGEQEIIDKINKNHAIGETLQPVPEAVQFTQQETGENKVLLVHYDAKQIYMAMVHKGPLFDKGLETERTLYNNYFGGGMNGIVFQEMREARGLAYSARANYQRPGKPERCYNMNTFIATQNDKMTEAIDAFNNILNDMPESEKAFDIAKESIITNIRTGRIIRADILWNYISAKDFGYTADSRKELFEKIPSMTLEDVKNFQKKYVKDQPYTYCILGDTKDIDMKTLEKIGKVTTLKQEDIFGY